MLGPERQSAWMSKITDDDLTRSGTGCFIAVPIWQQWAGIKELKPNTDYFQNMCRSKRVVFRQFSGDCILVKRNIYSDTKFINVKGYR